MASACPDMRQAKQPSDCLSAPCLPPLEWPERPGTCLATGEMSVSPRDRYLCRHVKWRQYQGCRKSAGGTIEPAPPPEATVSAATDLALRGAHRGSPRARLLPMMSPVLSPEMSAHSHLLKRNPSPDMPERHRCLPKCQDSFIVPDAGERADTSVVVEKRREEKGRDGRRRLKTWAGRKRGAADSGMIEIPCLPGPAAQVLFPCAPGPFLRTRASENHRGE